MLISDWSSDVCSSDLVATATTSRPTATSTTLRPETFIAPTRSAARACRAWRRTRLRPAVAARTPRTARRGRSGLTRRDPAGRACAARRDGIQYGSALCRERVGRDDEIVGACGY